MVEIIRFFGNPAIGNLIALITAIILVGTGWAIFSQFQVAQRSQFNDQLGRGAELLAHAELTARVSGVRVLEDLGKSVKPDSDENRLVANILLDFVRERAAPPLKEDGTPYEAENAPRHTLWDGMPYESSVAWPEPKPRDARLDIETAVLALGNIVPEDKEVRRKYLNFSRLDLRGLDLPGAKLQHAYIFHAKLQGADLKEANLQGAFLEHVNLQRADLQKANLQNARLFGANLHAALLLKTELQDTDLRYANLKGTLWEHAELQRAHLGLAELQRARLGLANLRDVKGLSQKQLAKIIYDKNAPPKNLPAGLQAPPDRAYEWLDKDGSGGKRYFVPFDKPWSEKNVDEWVRKEIAAEVAEETKPKK